MAAFWKVLAHVLTKAAVYASEHPDQVIAIVGDIKAAKGKGK